MGKHAIAEQKWAFSAEQTEELLKNPEHLRYRQGQLDSLLAVSRLQQGLIDASQLQELLDGLHKTWDAGISDAYTLGFEDMYSTLCEHLATRYDPEPRLDSDAATIVKGAQIHSGGTTLSADKPLKVSHWDLWLDK